MTATLEQTAPTHTGPPTTNSYKDALASEAEVLLVGNYGLLNHVATYRGASRITGKKLVTRTVIQYKGGVTHWSRNQTLLLDGTWGDYKIKPQMFKDEDAARDAIAKLPPARLNRPFVVGDRVRTVKPITASVWEGTEVKQAPNEILTGTIRHVSTGGGYGWNEIAWDKSPEGNEYFACSVVYANDIELIEG
jgi:hypothetical protein